MITVTLNQIKNAGPCTDGWKKVLRANGGTNAEMEKPFPLSSILDSNDLDDTLWVISNVTELSEHDEILRKFSSWCALRHVEKIAKYCSKEDYDLIVKWLETNNLALRESAAWSAARSARSAWLAAESAAWSAARLAARSVRSAARSAALSAARSAWLAAESAAWSAENEIIADKLREILDNGEWV